MRNLLAKYLAMPTAVHAKRVVEYDRKHPFAVTMMDRLELGVLQSAITADQHRAASVAILTEMGR